MSYLTEDIAEALAEQSRLAVLTGRDLIGTPETWYEVRQLREHLGYMDYAFDYAIDELTSEARSDGYDEGHTDGEDRGYDLGVEQGYENGRAEQYREDWDRIGDAFALLRTAFDGLSDAIDRDDRPAVDTKLDTLADLIAAGISI